MFKQIFKELDFLPNKRLPDYYEALVRAEKNNTPFASTKLTRWNEIRELFGLLAYGRLMINTSQHVFVESKHVSKGYPNSAGNFDFPAPTSAPVVFHSLKLKRSCPSRPQRWVAVAPHSLPKSLRNNSRCFDYVSGCWSQHWGFEASKISRQSWPTQYVFAPGTTRAIVTSLVQQNDPHVSQIFLQQSQVGPTWTDGTQRKAQVGWQHLGFLRCHVPGGSCEATQRWLFMYPPWN